jgi:hypothetical protein
MQKDLENYLKEDYAEDGTWTVEEKKRKLNEGCIAVVAHSTYPPTFTSYFVTGGSDEDDQIFSLRIPSDLLKPARLFVDGKEYQELTLSEWVRRKSGLVNPIRPTSTGVSAISRQNFDRFFWWDEAKNTFRINPVITSQVNIELYYVPMPNKLAEDTDISTLLPAFTHLPALWAAWRLLNKDEEQRDRGLSAKRDFLDGLAELERHRNRNPGNKTLPIHMDGGVFPDRSEEFDGRVDYNAAFDRLP